MRLISNVTETSKEELKAEYDLVRSVGTSHLQQTFKTSTGAVQGLKSVRITVMCNI